MALILRSEKGSALTIDELDGNFLYLSQSSAQATNQVSGSATTGSNDFIGSQSIAGDLTVTGSLRIASSSGEPLLTTQDFYALLPQVSASIHYLDDAAAAAGGVPLGGIYLVWDGDPGGSRWLTVRVV